MNILIKIIAITYFSISFCFASGDAQIKVVVANQVITSSDIEKRLKFARLFMPEESLDKTKLQEQVIQNLIEEKLIQREANKFKLQVGDAEVESYIEHLEKSNNQKSGHFLAEIKSKKISQESAFDYFRNKILLSKLLNYAVSRTVNVSDAEMEEFLSTVIPENTEISFKQIIYSAENILNESEYEKVLNKLNKLRNKIHSCNDLEISKLLSRDKFEVSDLKISLNNLHVDLRNIVRVLPIGKPSPIIKSSVGPQIIVVCKRDYSEVTLEEKEEIRYLLIQKKLEKQSLHYINKLKQKTYIEIKR